MILLYGCAQQHVALFWWEMFQMIVFSAEVGLPKTGSYKGHGRLCKDEQISHSDGLFYIFFGGFGSL